MMFQVIGNEICTFDRQKYKIINIQWWRRHGDMCRHVNWYDLLEGQLLRISLLEICRCLTPTISPLDIHSPKELLAPMHREDLKNCL